MRKILLLFVVFACAVLQGAAAQDMRSLFLNAPDEVFRLLTKNNRADCVDYLDASMRAHVSNRLGGTSVLKKLTGEYMYLEDSGNSWVEARLLPCGSDTIICMVKGVKAEVADSRVVFYDLMWNQLSTEPLLTESAIADFFASADSASVYAEKCDMYLVKYSLSPKEDVIVAEYTMPGYMNDGDAAVVLPLLRALSFRWNGMRFVRE